MKWLIGTPIFFEDTLITMQRRRTMPDPVAQLPVRYQAELARKRLIQTLRKSGERPPNLCGLGAPS